MRLIDADVFKENMDYICDAGGWLEPVTKAVREFVKKHIDVQTTVNPEPHWIPVTERLPERDGEYLVTYEKGYAEDYGIDLVGIAPFEVDCEGFGIWQENFDLHTLGSLGSDWVDISVIAWRELPAPYQPKEDES